MTNKTVLNAVFADKVDKVDKVFSQSLFEMTSKFDWIFGWIFVGQWAFSVFLAFVVSPRTWSGAYSQTHIHVYAAIFLGGLLAIPPMYLDFSQPGKVVNRYVNTVAQMFFFHPPDSSHRRKDRNSLPRFCLTRLYCILSGPGNSLSWRLSLLPLTTW